MKPWIIILIVVIFVFVIVPLIYFAIVAKTVKSVASDIKPKSSTYDSSALDKLIAEQNAKIKPIVDAAGNVYNPKYNTGELAL